MWLHDRFVENEDYAGIIVSVDKMDTMHTQLFLDPPAKPKKV